MLDGDDIQTIFFTDIDFPDGFAHKGAADRNLLDLDVVVQEDEVQKVAGDEALAQAGGHVAFRIDHFGADFLQDGALVLAGGFGDDAGDAEGDHVQGGQDAGVDFTADADHDSIAVLDADLGEGLFGEVVAYKGVFGVLPHGLDLFFVLIDDDDFLSGFRQGDGQCGAEAAQADDSEDGAVFFLFHIHDNDLPVNNLFYDARVKRSKPT